MSFFATYFLPFVLVLITFSIGLTLSLKDFRDIFLHPKAVLVGLFSQMVVLPSIAFGLVIALGLPPILQMGTMLIAACPGGATSNYVTYLCRGNVALSISLTSINSFLTIFTLPAVLYFSFQYFGNNIEQGIELPFWQTVLSVFLFTLLPCIAGMAARARWEGQAVWLNKRLETLLLFFLAAAFAGVFFEKDDAAMAVVSTFSIGQVFLVAVILNILGMFGGYLLARALQLSNADQVTIGIEVGLQNSMLAITVAGTLLHNMEMAQVGVVYGSFTFFTAVLFGAVFSDKVSIVQFIKTRKWYK